MGVPWGAPNDLNTFMAMVNNVPTGWNWSAFSLGRDQMAYVAAAVLAGGNVRVGLEDNLWLGKGQLATNAGLVERAVTIIENMGARVITPAEVRTRLGLTKRAPPRHMTRAPSFSVQKYPAGVRGCKTPGLAASKTEVFKT